MGLPFNLSGEAEREECKLLDRIEPLDAVWEKDDEGNWYLRIKEEN